MKTKTLALLFTAFTLSLSAQEKKPELYSFGLGYGINLGAGSPSQSLQLSVWLPKNFELTFPLGFSYSSQKNRTIDSTFTSSLIGLINVKRDQYSQTSIFSFSISPGFNYHIPLKSNLDLFVGVSIPISVTQYLKSDKVVDLVGQNYSSLSKEELISTPSLNFAGKIILGCNYFFYKNLALGARAQMGFNSSSEPKLKETVITTSNSGSNNFSQGTVISISPPKIQNTFSRTSIDFGASGGFYLTYYFGMKTKSKETTN